MPGTIHAPPPTPPDSGSEKAESISETVDTHFPLPPATQAPTDVLDVDKNTPDGWLARDPRLIRLTGVHPYNVEAPLSDLYNQGFLTTPELFYVRNHGRVPRVRDQEIPDWELSVEGMVESPVTLTFRQLVEGYEQHTYPVTLVCAGNRRKEQNVVRKTKGFSWGAAGVSTAIFTGTLMSDVMRRARPKRGAKYVCMEGADRLPNGCYGTSVKLNWAMDENRGIMLAHKMNGEMLRPDHGKPLRAVVPGQIGGRSVKWLKKLIVTAEPSDNWYHIYDNRVLPTMVSPEQSASDPKWWMDERYAIYDLSTNSAIAYPAHQERLRRAGAQKRYRVKGYAYGGGGRRVTRVELSLDQGTTWRLANIDYAEDRYREAPPQTLYGGTMDFGWRENSFCWCFWNLDMAVEELAGAHDMVVRAMDESMNVQPRDMYWSVLGMMNNPWYRLTISKEQDHLRFEHPTQPALMPGGWMERVKKAGGNLSNGYWGQQIGGENAAEAVVEPAGEVKMTSDTIDRKMTIDDVRKHNTKDSPWFIVNGEVYDGFSFLNTHPGGAQSIISAAGLDSTDEFMAIHSETAKAMMPTYHVGTLDEAGRAAALSGEAGHPPPPDPDSTARTTFLDPRIWRPATLLSKEPVSPDTRIFRFQLDHDQQTLGLPTGQHLMLRLRDPVTGEALIRSYTPVSAPGHAGSMDVLVKVYFASGARPGGRMSVALDSLAPGQAVEVKGPRGRFSYEGAGRCSVDGVARARVTTLYMICGGSGVAPIYQVLRAALQDPADPTRCVVLDGNRRRDDVLCKAALDRHAARHPHRCRLLYTLTRPPDDWTGLRGRIAPPLLRQHVDRTRHADGEAMVLICGPPALEDSCRRALREGGWKEEELVFF